MSIHRKLLIVYFIGFIFIIFEGSSVASSQSNQSQTYGQDSDLSIRLGAIGIYKPEYEGSDDYEFKGFPMINITWRDMIFFHPRKGLGAYLWNKNDMKFGVSMSYSFGRDEDDSGDLSGLGDIESGANANVLFERAIDDFSFNAHYEQQFTGSDTGFQVHLGLGYNLLIGEQTKLKPVVKTTYSSSDYVEEYFSISQSQSSRSGLPAFDADAGFKSVGLNIISIYRLSRHWGAQSMAGYKRLVGDAAESPVVKDENQYLFSVGLSYSF
jgi:outer membrane scaffolding protein for murein synthesis (MipA/OmpV family)